MTPPTGLVQPNGALKVSQPYGREPRVVTSLKKSSPEVAAAVAELRTLQRERAILIKSRIMISNRIKAIVAGTLGYHSGMDADERDEKMNEAGELIENLKAGIGDHPLKSTILAHADGIAGFVERQKLVEKAMLAEVKKLPVAKWVSDRPEQKGIGLITLAVIIGECGDLSNYANPGKVWRRMGCAPWEFDGKTLQGATWRGGKEGKLPAAEWESYGYSPRRRSIAYLVGVGIVKQNEDGPYRKRYDAVKKWASENRHDWVRCPKCDGAGSVVGKRGTKATKCGNCKATGKVYKRCHMHAMLLATKLFLKNLWVEWNS